MRVAYLDASAGISGDMLLGALVDAGLGLAGLEHELDGLGISGYTLAVEETRRAGLRACRVHVRLTAAHEHARRLADILDVIQGSKLAKAVKAAACRVFNRLVEAEARAHGVAVEETHLHEAGAIDAIVDVVGGVAGLAALGVEKLVCSPLRLGFGTVRCAHGLLPVPAPAVAELVKGLPVYAGEVEGEMVTPTGAALAATLAESFGPMPAMVPEAVGHGAGAAERPLPNILRLFLGREAAAGEAGQAELTVIEANIDDMNPEFYEYLCSRLHGAGALDTWLIPLQMKKGRPGTMLGLLAENEAAPALREIIFRESTTLGLRERRTMRYALARETVQVSLDGRPVAVKVGRDGGRILQLAPEYEDCARLAAELRMPLKDVYRRVLAAAGQQLAGEA